MSDLRFLHWLLNRRVILVGFVVITTLNTLASFWAGVPAETLAVNVFAVPVYGALAWYAYKRQPVATWMLIVVLILNGSGYLYDGLTNLIALQDGSTIANLLRVVAGMFLSWGMLVIYQERRGQD